MTQLSTLHASVTHRCLIYGAPKTGKSLLAGKLAQYYELIWIDLENGHDVLFQLPKEWQERVDLIAIPDTRSYPVAIETCLKMVKGAVTICNTHGKVSCMLCKKAERADGDEKVGVLHNKYFIDLNLPAIRDNNKIVVFDSMTQLTNSAIAHITKSQPDDYKLNYDDWGNLGKLMDIFLSHIQQAGYNVICISHETRAESEDKKSKLVPVAGTRNFSRNSAKYFNHVIYAEVKAKRHTFLSSTTASTWIMSGSRSDIAIEDYPEAGLLPIFKPELYPAKKPTPITKTKPTLGGKAKATDILARLKSKGAK